MDHQKEFPEHGKRTCSVISKVPRETRQIGLFCAHLAGIRQDPADAHIGGSGAV
jgi:hypothetical protein